MEEQSKANWGWLGRIFFAIISVVLALAFFGIFDIEDWLPMETVLVIAALVLIIDAIYMFVGKSKSV